MLIGLKPCFYNTIETQNEQELLTQWRREQREFTFDYQGKQVDFFYIAVFSN